MIKKIVLAVDLGINTSYLLQYAASLSNQYRASLIVVHAIEPLGTLGYSLLQTYLQPEVSRNLTVGSMDSLVEQLRSQVIDILTDEYMAGEIKLPRLEGVIVRPGDPVDVILEITQEVDADMLVLGSQASKAGSGNMQVGYVTQKMVNSSKVPVYLIPCAQPVCQEYKPNIGDMRPPSPH